MDFKIIILPLLAFGISYLSIPLLVLLSKKFSIEDKAGKRKRHKAAISMLGGVPLFTVLILSSIFLLDFNKPETQLYAMLSFSILFFTGLYDDLKPLNASKKFIFQIISAIILVYLAGVHHSSYFTQLAISEDLVKIISVVLIVFIINAYNLIDGINGLSAMLSMIALLGFGVWFYTAELEPLAYICFSLAAAILAFLRFNLFNTKIFLGDNGSMLLGLAIAYFSTVFIQSNQNLGPEIGFKLISPFGVALAAMAIPVMDTLRLFIMRSVYLEKSPFKADRNHLHHILLRLGLSHVQISTLLTTITFVLLVFAFAAQKLGNTGIIFIIALIYIALLIALDYFISNRYRKKIHKKTVFNEAMKFQRKLDNPMAYELFFALSFFILAVAIPFHRISTSIPSIVILFALLVLSIHNFISKKGEYAQIFKLELLKFLKHPYSILILTFLGFHILHFLIIPTNGTTALSIKLLLLIYWIPFFELRKIINIKPEYILRAYIYGCFGFSFFILYHAFFAFHKLGWDAFFYSDLLSHVNANPITHSLYFNIAIVFIASNFKFLKSKIWKLIHLIMLLFFVFMVILFSSKLGYIALAICIFASIFLLEKRLLRRVIFSIVFVALAYSSYVGVPYVKNRIDGFIWQFEKHDAIKMDNKLPRTIIWKESVFVIKENWLKGTGVGISMDVMAERYEKIGYKKGVKERFNTHNQFLEIFLQTGIIGFLIFIALYAYSFYVAIKNRSMVYGLFLFILLLYMMIESLFETQMGMVAFAFFNALFVSSFAKKNGSNSEINQNSLE